jgi:GrxC family glutaredoxin
MSRVRIYTKQECRFSEKALMFLEEKGVPYDEIDITGDHEAEEEMVEAAGGSRTTPQIFIDGEHIGGFDELVEEDAHGRLAMRLASGLEQPDVT